MMPAIQMGRVTPVHRLKFCTKCQADRPPEGGVVGSRALGLVDRSALPVSQAVVALIARNRHAHAGWVRRLLPSAFGFRWLPPILPRPPAAAPEHRLACPTQPSSLPDVVGSEHSSIGAADGVADVQASARWTMWTR